MRSRCTMIRKRHPEQSREVLWKVDWQGRLVCPHWRFASVSPTGREEECQAIAGRVAGRSPGVAEGALGMPCRVSETAKITLAIRRGVSETAKVALPMRSGVSEMAEIATRTRDMSSTTPDRPAHSLPQGETHARSAAVRAKERTYNTSRVSARSAIRPGLDSK